MNFKKKVLITVIFLIISSIIYVLFFQSLWNSSSYDEETKQTQEYIYTNLKKIKFINTKNEVIDVSMNFEYSKQEIKERNLHIVDYYNKESLIRLQPNSDFIVVLPISTGDKLKFPDKFSVTLKDSVKKNIKQYDTDSFFENVVSKPVIENNQEKYNAKEWILNIE